MASGEKYNYYKVDLWSAGCVAYFLYVEFFVMTFKVIWTTTVFT